MHLALRWHLGKQITSGLQTGIGTKLICGKHHTCFCFLLGEQPQTRFEAWTVKKSCHLDIYIHTRTNTSPEEDPGLQQISGWTAGGSALWPETRQTLPTSIRAQGIKITTLLPSFQHQLWQAAIPSFIQDSTSLPWTPTYADFSQRCHGPTVDRSPAVLIYSLFANGSLQTAKNQGKIMVQPPRKAHVIRTNEWTGQICRQTDRNHSLLLSITHCKVWPTCSDQLQTDHKTSVTVQWILNQKTKTHSGQQEHLGITPVLTLPRQIRWGECLPEKRNPHHRVNVIKMYKDLKEEKNYIRNPQPETTIALTRLHQTQDVSTNFWS